MTQEKKIELLLYVMNWLSGIAMGISIAQLVK